MTRPPPPQSPQGRITFYDGTTSLGTTTLTGSASTVFISSLNLSTLAPGQHTLSAVYTPGSTDISAASSAGVNITIAPQDYTLTTSVSSLSIQTEHHAPLTVSVNSIGGYAGAILLSCGAPLPTYLSCEMGGDRAPSSAQLLLAANGTTAIQLMLDTDVVLDFKSSLDAPPSRRNPWREIAFAGLLPLGLLAFARRRKTALHRVPRLCVWLLCLVAALTSLSGCGDKYPAHVAPGTYSIPIQATGIPNGGSSPVTHTTTLTLIVTP